MQCVVEEIETALKYDSALRSCAHLVAACTEDSVDRPQIECSCDYCTFCNKVCIVVVLMLSLYDRLQA